MHSSVLTSLIYANTVQGVRSIPATTFGDEDKAVMATYGKIQPFNPASDEWTLYVEKLQFYFVANGIVNAVKKRSILLTVCADSTFKLLRSLVPDGKLDADDVTYDSLVALLKDHYGPKHSTIVHRFHFNTRSRQPSESITVYVAALRELALDCKYGSTELLEEMLRDRLVCGVNHPGIQHKLLAEVDLTFKSALKLAQTMESSETDAKKLQGDTPQPAQVSPTLNYATFGRQANAAGISCYHCGGPHLANQCKHMDAACSHCKKVGHFASVCRTKARQAAQSWNSQPQEKAKKPTSTRTNYVEDEESPPTGEYDMCQIRDNHTEPYVLDITLNNVPVKMELDTGAAVSVISETTYNRIRGKSPLQPADIRLRTYTGDQIRVLGSAKVQVRYDKIEVCLSVHGVQGSGPNLLGKDWMEPLQVNLKTIHVVNPGPDPIQKVLDAHAQVFDDSEVGCLKGPPVKLVVNSNSQPKFYRPRSLPLLWKPLVEEELSNLQQISSPSLETISRGGA